MTAIKTDGTEYALPITLTQAEIASPVPQHSDLMNQTSICADEAGHPVIATYFRPAGGTTVQYAIVRFDSKNGRQFR